MKRGTKYFLAIVIALSALQLRAQTFGLKGGVNLNTVSYVVNDAKWSNLYNMTTPGFHFGGTMTGVLSEVMSLETGLLVSLKGFKLDKLNDIEPYGVKTHLFYLDVPVLLKSTHDMGAKSQWYWAAGPFFNVGLGGNYVAMYDWGGSKQGAKEKVKWGNGEDEIKRFDVGVSLGGGLTFDIWDVGIYYDLGLIDISPNQENVVHNRLWKISVGYKLGQK